MSSHIARGRSQSYAYLNLAAVLVAVFVQQGGIARATLVGHWSYDDGAGTTAQDSTANNNDGTLSGSATFTAGGFLGGAVNFAGGQVGYSSAVVSSLDAANDYTVTAWINPTAFASYTCLWDTPGRHLSFFVSGASSTGATGYWGSGTSQGALSNSPAWTAGAWQMVTMTGDDVANQIKTYRNAVNNSTGSGSGTSFTQAWTVGGNPSGGGTIYSGLVDDVAVFDKVLSSAKITALYSVATTASLSYNAFQGNTLFNLFDAAGGSTTVAGTTWNYQSGLTGTPGIVQFLGNDPFGQPKYVLVLDNLGNGLATPSVPEPSTFALLGLGAIGLAIKARRRTAA